MFIYRAINNSEAYNPGIGLLLNFGSRRLECHRFTNKRYNPKIVLHPKPSHSFRNLSSDL